MQYIKAFFVGLGVIFFCILLVLLYLWVVDPWNIKPLLQAVASPSAPVSEQSQTSANDSGRSTGDQSFEAGADTSTNATAGMSDAQVEALGSVGLSADTIPATFTAEQEACFIEILGAPRVEEIKNGAVPTATEFWQARGCL